MKAQVQEKLFDLLGTKALYGLSAEELRDFEAEFPEWLGDDSFEIAAAAINLTFVDAGETMPAGLRSKILAAAESQFEWSPKVSEEVRPAGYFERTAETTGRVPASGGIFSPAPKVSFGQWFGWGVAALAGLALVANLYLTQFQNQPVRVAEQPDVRQTPAVLTAAQKREQLLAAAGTVNAAAAKADPKMPGQITGDIVWNNAEQKGYMRFRGLPVNDPAKSTYQLWIFDEARDDKYPIDGGVFDVTEDGEVIIPIDAKINVKNPKMFAVTREKPGGVVVSARTGVVVIAKV